MTVRLPRQLAPRIWADNPAADSSDEEEHEPSLEVIEFSGFFHVMGRFISGLMRKKQAAGGVGGNLIKVVSPRGGFFIHQSERAA